MIKANSHGYIDLRLSKTLFKPHNMKNQRPDIRIVLVNTSHPGNIGGVARAMKNMCLEQLVLVDPMQYPHAQATARASGADDVLNAAEVHPITQIKLASG